MREIQASEAKTHLPQLLDDIERGETVIITRHGRPIARLIPEASISRDRRIETVERLKALRATMPNVPLDELVSGVQLLVPHGGIFAALRALRHEGYKY